MKTEENRKACKKMGLCGEGKYSSISPSLTVDGKNNRHIPRIKRAVAVSALFIPLNVFKIVLQVYCLSIFFSGNR